ncbi:MAG: hypothetical protein ACI915_005213 [Gammaproteobacteria bacterium]|jgi:hypothetical protein
MSKPVSLLLNRVLIGLCIATAIVVWRVDVPHDSFGGSPSNISEDRSDVEHSSISVNTTIKQRAAEDYLEIVQRTLFNPTRRPPETDGEPAQTFASDIAASKASEISTSKLKLLGLIIDKERRAALIVDMDTVSTRLVDVGDNIAGWQLEEIDVASATLTKNSRSEQLTLVRKSDPLTARRVQSALRRRQQSSNATVATNNKIQAAPNHGNKEDHDEYDEENEDEDADDELLDDEDQ